MGRRLALCHCARGTWLRARSRRRSAGCALASEPSIALPRPSAATVSPPPLLHAQCAALLSVLPVPACPMGAGFREMASAAGKIKVENPVVDLDGDEMTR